MKFRNHSGQRGSIRKANDRRVGIYVAKSWTIGVSPNFEEDMMLAQAQVAVSADGSPWIINGVSGGRVVQ